MKQENNNYIVVNGDLIHGGNILMVDSTIEVYGRLRCSGLVAKGDLIANEVIVRKGPCVIKGDLKVINGIDTFGKPIYCGGEFDGDLLRDCEVYENFTEWESLSIPK